MPGSVILSASITPISPSDQIDLYNGLTVYFSNTKLYFGESYYEAFQTTLVLGIILTKLALPSPPPSLVHSPPAHDKPPPVATASASIQLQPPPLNPNPPSPSASANISHISTFSSQSSSYSTSFATQDVWIGAIGAGIALVLLCLSLFAIKRWRQRAKKLDCPSTPQGITSPEEDQDVEMENGNIATEEDREIAPMEAAVVSLKRDRSGSALPSTLKESQGQDATPNDLPQSSLDLESGERPIRPASASASASATRPQTGWKSLFGSSSLSLGIENNPPTTSQPITWRSIFGSRSKSNSAAPQLEAKIDPVRRMTLPPLERQVMERVRGTTVTYPAVKPKVYEKQGVGSIKLPLSYGGGMSGGGGGGSFNPSSIPPLPPNRVRRSQAGHRSDGGGKEGEGGELKRHFMTRKPSQHEAMQARASEALRKESISSRSGGNRGEGLSDNQPMWSRKSSGRESVHMADNPLAIEMMAASEVEEEVEEVSTPRGDGVKVLGPDGQSMSPGTQERRRSAKKPLSARKSGRRMSDVAVGSLTMEDDGTRITEDLDTMDELRLPAPKRISGNWAI